MDNTSFTTRDLACDQEPCRYCGVIRPDEPHLGRCPRFLSANDEFEITRYESFRRVRRVRDVLCRNPEGKKVLTRVMRRLKK